MYEILSTTYGVVPTPQQYKDIENHYGDWPEHLGEDPYNGSGDSSAYIGVEIENLGGAYSLHGKPVTSAITILPNNTQIAEAKKRCDEIRTVVSGCQNFPQPKFIYIWSTS